MDADGFGHLKSVYFEECHELLQVMDEQLLKLDSGQFSNDDLNALFRAVHSIKGGSGAFGLDALTNFVHIFENVLDLMRNQELEVEGTTVDLLFRAKDILASLVELSQQESPIPPSLGAEVLEELRTLAKIGVTPVIADAMPVGELQKEQDTTLPPEIDQSGNADGHYVIKFKPSKDMLAVGGEPLYLLRELDRLSRKALQNDKSPGSSKNELDRDTPQCAAIVPDVSHLPDLALLDAEDAYLAWTVTVPGNIQQSAIEEVFEFVDEGSEVTISFQNGTLAKNDSKIDSKEETAYGLFYGSEGNAPDKQSGDDPSAVLEKTEKTASVTKDQGKREHTKEQSLGQKTPPSHPPTEGRGQATSQSQSIRVEIEKIDRLVNMVGELVITQAMLAQQASLVPEDLYPGLFQGLDQLSFHTRDLQESVMAIRAQPVRSVFSRMPRLVRDTARALGKEIQLIMTGEGTEVDRTVVERLADPLTHMIRNAVDHAIEPPDVRQAAGKPVQGTVHLSAEHRSGKILITIADDGKGIDGEVVLAKAKEKGLVPEDAVYSADQALDLIFLPGLSTADKVSDISGRGVGMDVVKRNIAELGGRISLHSKVGEGTKVVMSLPLTLAVLDGMLVRLGEERYVLPLLTIVESIRPKQEEIQSVMDKFDVLRVRGENVPLETFAR